MDDKPLLLDVDPIPTSQTKELPPNTSGESTLTQSQNNYNSTTLNVTPNLDVPKTTNDGVIGEPEHLPFEPTSEKAMVNPNMLFTQNLPQDLQKQQNEFSQQLPKTRNEKGIDLCEHKKSLLITTFVWGGIIVGLVGLILGSLGIMIAGFIIAGIGYILNVVYTCCSDAAKYLRNILPTEECLQHLNLMRNTAPTFWYSIQNYHYETRTRTTTDSKGNTKTETYTERVNTHYAKGYFSYHSWMDVSEVNYPNLMEYVMTRLNLNICGYFGDDRTRNHYEHAKRDFYYHNTRDTHQDKYSGVSLHGLKTRILIESQPGAKPTCMNQGYLYLISVFGCNLCYRMWMNNLTGRKFYVFQKKIWC